MVLVRVKVSLDGARPAVYYLAPAASRYGVLRVKSPVQLGDSATGDAESGR